MAFPNMSLIDGVTCGKRLHSLQTHLRLGRWQYAVYVFGCGLLAIGVFLGAYMWLFRLDDSMLAFAMLLGSVSFGMVWLMTRPFEQVKVVDFYADYIEISPWDFWRGRKTSGRKRHAYTEVVQCQLVHDNVASLWLRFKDGELLRLRILRAQHVFEFLQQHKAMTAVACSPTEASKE